MSTISTSRDSDPSTTTSDRPRNSKRTAQRRTPSTQKRAKPAARKEAAAPPPWILDGIDYGPAVLAIEDLAEWAFDLARENVAGWPEGVRRVKHGRRAVLDMIRGRRPRAADEDVVFTALLLIRILDADLELGANEILAVLAELGLPTEDVPPPRPPGSRRTAVRITQPPPTTPAAALAAILGVPAEDPLAPVVPITRPRRPHADAAPHLRVVPAARAGFAMAA